MNNHATVDVTNPSTGVIFTSLAADTEESAKAKLRQASQLYQNRSRRLLLHERINLLEKLLDHVSRQQKTFVDTMVKEGGKPWQDSLVEFHRAMQGIRLAIETVSTHSGSSIPLGYQPSSAGRIATTRVFPVGVVLAFSAFNHPLNLIVHQIIPAFASGCPCVVKPAADTPLSCILLVKAMHDVGIPEAYIQAVITRDLEVAGELVASDKIAFFSFIGSAKVGWMLRSRLQPGVRCALEHGGVAPSIVSRHADLELAVPAIAKGSFYHAGQVCVSTQRVYVEKAIYEEFVEKLKNKANTLRVGNAMNEDSEVGPLIRPEEITRIHTWVEEAINEGAECILGGKVIDERFYAPTILLNPAVSSKVTTQEIFGPVVCIYHYEDFTTALELCNHEKFAFQASIYSQDMNEVMLAHEVIDASAVMVNDHTAFRDDAMPFAGLRASGLGVGGIPYTIEDMQYEKMLVLRNV